MATITAGDFRNGKTFEMDGKIMQVVEFQHVKPGKGAAFVRTKMKNVVTGAVTETSFNPTAKFEEAFIERKDYEYSYNDGDLYYFMDQETYDMVPVSKDMLDDSFKFIKENTPVKLLSYKGNVFSVETPNFVELTVTKADPGVKGDTATNVTKPATVETGAEIKVPLFINEGEKMSPADQSVGKQLPYVPEHSASLTGRLSWRTWAFLYKWAYYSERFTMSSNDYTLTGHLPRYFMSNISLEKMLSFKPLDVQLKLAVNNLFNEDYLSVLSRPMPGINFEFFIGITPKFGKSRK